MAKSIYIGLHSDSNDTPIVKKVEEIAIKAASNSTSDFPIKIVQGIYRKDDNGAIKQVYERKRTVTFTQNGNLETLTGQDRVFAADADNAFYNIKLNDYFSTDDKRGQCTVTIDNGVYLVPSNSWSYGLHTGSYYNDFTLKIYNNGTIYGAGGAGGNGRNSGGTGYNGSNGEAAIYLNTDIDLINTGIIAGGGGGGGAGGNAFDDDCCGSSDEIAGGGGGGGGQCFGTGGKGSTYGIDGKKGENATFLNPGYGGAGGNHKSQAIGGDGGNGGTPGSNGARGGSGDTDDGPYGETNSWAGGSGGTKGKKYKNQYQWKVNGSIPTT